MNNPYLSDIEHAIASLPLPSHPLGLYEPIRYMLDGGGKRIRPTLALAFADGFGLNPDKLMPQALGVEMFHNFTLLHDDLMDRSTQRHNRPTVHIKWNAPTAILSGDTMLTIATRLTAQGLSGALLSEVMERFNRTAIEVYEGQQLDMNFESQTDVSEEEYTEMIRLKTSVLLGYACWLGARIAGKDAATTESAYLFGEELGLAFQLRDDWLDTFGDADTFGKPIGGDIINDKKTWLAIMALRLDTTGTLSHEIEHPSDSAVKIDRIRQLYVSLGLDSRLEDLIAAHTHKAVELLGKMNLRHETYKFLEALTLQAQKRRS